jgi:O-antigen ligase
MNYSFPAALVMNGLSITALLVFFGLTGQLRLAADVGLVQGMMLVLFFSFSANSRSIILNEAKPFPAHFLLFVRLILIIPLGGLAFYYLHVYMSNIDRVLGAILILRRIVEWIGELHLSKRELAGDFKFARNYFLLEVILFLSVVCYYALGITVQPFAFLLVWATVPLVMHVRYISGMFETKVSLSGFGDHLRILLPQFGSTMIIGVTVYVFRFMIIMVTGKADAGDLFTAFAIGGVIGSVFAQAMGPSVALYESRNVKKNFSNAICALLIIYLLAGFLLLSAAYFHPAWFVFSTKSSLFWGATGASMIGGVLMVYAQHIRYRILQTSGGANLFGPDIYTNILVFTSVPLLYYILGRQSLMVLFLISAILALITYHYAEREALGEKQYTIRQYDYPIAVLIALGVLLPVFFQIKGGVFNDPSMVFDSGGFITRLPIPLSVAVCIIGIPLIGLYKNAGASLTMVFLSFILMIFSSLVTTNDQYGATQAKFILLLQFVLPMFALFLGQLYERIDGKMLLIGKVFFGVLCVIVPLQLLCSWLQGYSFLSPYMYIFSIYQHLQYVPVVFAGAFVMVLFSLGDHVCLRKWIGLFLPVMALYVFASNAVNAMLLFALGISAYVLSSHLKRRATGTDKKLIVVIIVASLLVLGYLSHYRNMTMIDQKFDFSQGNEVDSMKMNGLQQRFAYWKFYSEEATKDMKSFFIGNAGRPDRKKYPSAHNYYLDFIYHFGFLPLVPLLILIGSTLRGIYRKRREIGSSPELMGLIIVVLFLLFIDNMLKVGLRQPYPGIFSFFLWGILISKVLDSSLRRSTNI